MRPLLPAGLTVSADNFEVAEKSYPAAETDLFTTLPDPAAVERTIALFLPATADSAAVAARKIPHYGKYSHLVFRSGTNVAKGIWPAPQSPMVHIFHP